VAFSKVIVYVVRCLFRGKDVGTVIREVV